VVAISPEQLKKHKEYLKNNLKKNFFNWIFYYKESQNLFFSQI
jgi:hypothetical protein